MNIDDRAIFDAIRARRGAALGQADVNAINAIMYPKGSDQIAWGAKVSPAFRDKVRAMCSRLRCDPSDMMSCIAWESGRSFSASVRNAAGSGATGLIQFMPDTARDMGTTVEALAAMTAEAQLDWVEEYFRPYIGKLNTIADLYMAILWPVAVGKPMDYVLWDKATRPTTYRQNIGLDTNRDGEITKHECAARLLDMKAEGMKPENMA